MSWLTRSRGAWVGPALLGLSSSAFAQPVPQASAGKPAGEQAAPAPARNPEPAQGAAQPPQAEIKPPDFYYRDQGEVSPAEPPHEPPGAEAPYGSAAASPEVDPNRDAPRIIFEPPPPPPPLRPVHTAPKDALWVGLRAGLFSPFGLLWAKASLSRSGLLLFRGIPWHDYASLGPAFEANAGARLGRNYNVFALWEHAFLPSGTLADDSTTGQSWGNTDYWALGLRINSNPDNVGFVAEVAVGYRRFTASWSDGTDLVLSDGVFETRVGLGAEIRLSPKASLTPLLTLAAGTFGEASWEPERPDAVFGDDVGRLDEQASHGALTLTLGGHLDLFGR